MNDGDGNSDGDIYVTKGEFGGVLKNLERLNLALWGSEGTTGIVATLQEMKTEGKMMDRVITIVLTILTSVFTALIIKGLI